LCGAKYRPLREHPSPEDFVASIAQSGNDVAKNWLRIAAGGPGQSGPAEYLARLGADTQRVGALQAEYLEKQRRCARWRSCARSTPASSAARCRDRCA
jgi:hypothetical protein